MNGNWKIGNNRNNLWKMELLTINKNKTINKKSKNKKIHDI